ncbi:MAG: rRNA pseudouridine synthase [Acidimicrobiaceae bacterium]|nr:rRNA pseudouridine synthase [Acidimicrobiaceae bacterium]
MSGEIADQTEKLHKVLARSGYGSRRSCENMISDGLVEVNGATAQVGARVNIELDSVKVSGEIVGIRPDLVYIILNKPKGIISSVSDPQGRPTAVDLVPCETRIYPVGRLDFDSEGLLLLTNDGDLTNLITHPSNGVEKEYLVQVDRAISEKAISKLRNGVELGDGISAPAKLTKLSETLIRIVIHEGRNRQVRRMFEVVGFRVVRLVRTRVGPIRDSNLRQGEWRVLNPEEVVELRNEASTSADRKASTMRRRS